MKCLDGLSGYKNYGHKKLNGNFGNFSFSNEDEFYCFGISMHNDKNNYEKLEKKKMTESHFCLIIWKIICTSSNVLSVTQKGNVGVSVFTNRIMHS